MMMTDCSIVVASLEDIVDEELDGCFVELTELSLALALAVLLTVSNSYDFVVADRKRSDSETETC